MGVEKRVERIKKRLSRTYSRIERMRHERLKMPFAAFVTLMPYMTKETIEALTTIDAPQTFADKAVPKDLQLVTFGTLTQLQGAPQGEDYLRTCCAIVSVLTGIESDKVATMPAEAVLGVVNMVSREMERIGKLFKALETDKSAEEMGAGIDTLNFGAFGICDWYAKRMGIVDHEEVFAVPWVRVYQCMRIDRDTNEFEKRLRKIYENKTKRSK